MAKLKELNEKMLELSKPTIFIASNIQWEPQNILIAKQASIQKISVFRASTFRDAFTGWC